MPFVEHPLIKSNTIESRTYQEAILNTASKRNTLCVLPTGLGKTTLAILLAAHRLEKHLDSKVLITAPTRPLCAQHQKTFRECLNIPEEEIILLTGKVSPGKRYELYKQAKIISATPQCVDGNTEIFVIGEGPTKIKDFVNNKPLKLRYYKGKKAFCADINLSVLGLKGNLIQPVNAIKAWKILTNSTIEIETELKNFIECTPEHPLLTINKNGDIEWKSACYLEKDIYIAVCKRFITPNKQFSIFNTLKNSNMRLTDRELIKKLLAKHKKMKLPRGDISKYNRATMPLSMFFKLAKICNFQIPNILYITNKTGKSKPIPVRNSINKNICYIIGAMLGDGHIGNSESKGKEVVFSANDKPTVMHKFENYIYEEFGLKPKKDPKKGLIYYSTVLGESLIRLGVPAGEKGNIIRVPKYFFEQEEELIKYFISGLFDTDGSASNSIRIISTISSRMASDVKWLLLKLGIISSINYYDKNTAFIRNKIYNTKPFYDVQVSNENQLNYLLETCPFDKTKCKFVFEHIANIKRHGTRSKEIIPVPSLLQEVYKEHRANGGSRLDDVVISYSMNTLSQNSLKNILPKLNSNKKNKILELMNLPIRWVKIKNIEEIKKPKWVYDLTIENEHNFIGNCIINHNTIDHDLKNEILDLSDFSLLIVDEVHRAVKRYSYPFVAKTYMQEAKNPRILGLTASPGSDEEKIKRICKNLFIDSVEIRTEIDEDVKPYIKGISAESLRVDLPENLKNAQDLLKTSLKERLEKLKKYNLFIKTKRDLLEAQKKISRQIATQRKPFMFYLISLIVESVKIWHVLELLETQSIKATKIYLEKIKQKKTKSDKGVLNDINFIKAIKIIEESEEHPKITKLKEVLKREFEENKDLKIIVFSHFRDNIHHIHELIQEICRPVILIGQAGERGLTQKEQIDVIKDFNAGYYNCLITSPIGEEGLHIPSADTAIFYDSVPSEIRTIQRRGRVGRTKVGKIIFLLTRGTRDEGYFWTAQRREKKMKSILREMQNKNNKEQQSIDDFVN